MFTRSQALKTKERMAQVSTGSSQMGFGRGSSQPNLSTSYSEEYGRSEGSPASYHGCEYWLVKVQELLDITCLSASLVWTLNS